jgi:hypothetical protein
LEAFVLLGLLANYNKFEFRNPYRLRLEDFVNEIVIKKTVQCVGTTCLSARAKYTAIQEDLPEGWNISSTLKYFGLGGLNPRSRPASPLPGQEESKNLFAVLYVQIMPSLESILTGKDQARKLQSFFPHTIS